jgi:tRNA 2-thiocytidine biosynthesis protein TtcA
MARTAPETASCALSSRLRDGNLYRVAHEEGCAVVVLGHHRDDVMETFMLSPFQGGWLATIASGLITDEGDFLVLCPLAHGADAATRTSRSRWPTR